MHETTLYSLARASYGRALASVVMLVLLGTGLYLNSELALLAYVQ